MSRQKANLEIIARLLRRVLDNPDERFGQMLRNAGIVVDFQRPATNPWDSNPVEWMNHFNEEPIDMVARMNKTENKKEKA